MTQLSDEDIAMLKYYWEEKGSIERYSRFQEIKPVLEKHYPALMKAWSDYKASLMIFNHIIKTV